MKQVFYIIFILCVCLETNAQNKWFTTYQDSAALVKDANKLIQQLADRLTKVDPTIDLHKNIAVKNTKPYLIFINNDTVNLPFWTEVIPQQQRFFAEVAGGENEGKDVFGLFFNGFYLAHELGHSFFKQIKKKYTNAYDSEYDANTFAILYWQAADEKENLKKCYDYAQKMLKTLENPVPQNEDYKKYITDNYRKLASDPYKYGYIQFSQFVEIYNNRKLVDFDAYIKGR